MKNIFAKKELTPQEQQSKSLNDLQDELNAGTLVVELQKNNSFKRNFLLSLAKGAGTAIGATVIAGIVLTMLVRIIQSSENIPFIGDYVEQSEYLNKIKPSDG